MKGVSGKQIFTYIVLVAILGTVAVYFLVYKKNVEKTEALEASNATLEARVQSLKTYYDNQQTYKDDMAIMEPEIDTILSKYVSDVREEDQIMQAVISQRLATVQYESINLSKTERILTIPEQVVQGANVEKYQNEIAFASRETSYVNKLDYHNLKAMIQTLFDSEYNIGIKGISYSTQDVTESTIRGMLDEETGEIVYVKDSAEDKQIGILNGTLDLVFYYVEGNGVEYTKPDMEEYISGTEDFFALKKSEEEEEEEE